MTTEKTLYQTIFELKKQNREQAVVISKLRNESSLARNRVKQLEQQIEKMKKTEEERLEEAIAKAVSKAVVSVKKEYETLIENLNKKITKLEARLNVNSTNSGIPTSKDRINAKISNTREKTNSKIGGQPGHEIHKLKQLTDEEITSIEEKTLDVCPNCGGNLKEINVVKADVIDFVVTVEKIRNNIHNYKCTCCGKKVSADNELTRGVTYGKNVDSIILSTLNESNIAINKVSKHISGLTNGEIQVSEGYIAKVQKKAADNLNNFMSELKTTILNLPIVHWDDTVIKIQNNIEDEEEANNRKKNKNNAEIIEDNGEEASNKKSINDAETKKIRNGIIRFYGNDQFAYIVGHRFKDKIGIDEDGILSNLSSECVCVHDHVLLNYNDEYEFVNAECNAHILRYLKQVKDNLQDHTWQDKLKELLLFAKTEKEKLIEKKINSFDEKVIIEIASKYDECIKLGYEENNKTSDYHFYKDREKSLIKRLEKFKDNHLLFIKNFSVPFTNNTSEQGIRLCKRKMAVSGLFKNSTRMKDYAKIISYLETCYRNSINRTEACKRLMAGNPYTVAELLQISETQNKQQKNEIKID